MTNVDFKKDGSLGNDGNEEGDKRDGDSVLLAKLEAILADGEIALESRQSDQEGRHGHRDVAGGQHLPHVAVPRPGQQPALEPIRPNVHREHQDVRHWKCPHFFICASFCSRGTRFGPYTYLKYS